MRHGLRLAAAILAGFGSAAAAAPFSYNCDTAAGSLSEIKQEQNGPAYAVAGKIGPRQTRTHERWLPTAMVRVEAKDGARFVTLQLVPQVRGGTTFAIVAASTNGDKKGRAELGKMELNETLAFTIRAGRESVRVEAGGKSIVFPVAIGAGGHVAVSCSTGEFDFGTLDLEAEAE